MKKFAKLAYSLAALILLAACSSDRSPVDFINTDFTSKDAKTYIQLTLNPSSTRAISEDAISVVNLYVFNAADPDNVTLEKTIPDKNVTSNSVTLDLELDPGKKIFYAITSTNALKSEAQTGMTLSDFESKKFTSTLSEICSESKGMVMIGKSDVVNIASTKTEGYVPSSNKFSINLTRLVAKVNVTSADLSSSLSELGFKVNGPIYFKAFQTNNELRLTNEGYMYDSYDKIGMTNGTYNTYTFDNTAIAYSEAKNSSASNVQYQYVPENIVENPVSGNTSFIAIRAQLIPNKIWAYDLYAYPGVEPLSETDNYSTGNFYVCSIVKKSDPETIIDYYKSTGRIMYFKDQTALTQYKLKYMPTLSNEYEYKELCYTNGYAYYRINIKDNKSGKYRVYRNKSYQIDLKSLNTLGVNEESKLRPSDASTPIEDSSVSYMIGESTFSISDWSTDSNNQEVVL